MTQKQKRMKRELVFSSNLEFKPTLKALQESDLVEYVTETGTRGREGEGKSPEGGKLRVTMKGWDPPAFLLSSQGKIQCWYYEDIVDVNEVLKIIPEGWAYAYPEYTAVVAIRNVLGSLLIPMKGEEIEIHLVRSSLDRDYFEKLRSQRYEKISSKISDLQHICSCGRSYTSETWYKKHIEKCSNYDISKSYLQFKGILAKPGPVIVIGQSPFGFVTFKEIKTAEELKAAAERMSEIPLLLGHPRKERW